IKLAVANPGAGAHLLHLAWPDHGTGPHAVLMFKGALEHVGDDFHVAMRMRGKPVARLDAIFVDHAQAAEGHEPRIVIVAERKCGVRIEPAIVGMAALPGRSYLNHCLLPAARGRSVSLNEDPAHPNAARQDRLVISRSWDPPFFLPRLLSLIWLTD